eukprot:GFUD01003433.1.p1 GENE.GFUD01003433.1~~GFUD01003433.1.p1  ORF type:complete len:764 (+),score=132.24 GFUD01003433.1:47-2338(+)
MAGDDEQLNLLLSNISQQPADLNSVLYRELDQTQAEYFKIDEDLQPSQQLKMYEENVNQELTLDEIQRILDLPSTALLNITQNMQQQQRKNRSESMCISSPESGISGCDEQESGSPANMEQVQSPYQNQMYKQDSVSVSFTPAETAAIYNTQNSMIDIPGSSHNYFEGIDMSTLLQLADESNQLMESSETDLERLAASKPFIASPLITSNNPMFGQQQQQPAMQNRSSTVFMKTPYGRTKSTPESNNKIVITGPNHLGTSDKKTMSPTPSVIVTNANAFSKVYKANNPATSPPILPTNTITYTYEAVSNPSSNFSIPGSMIFANSELLMDNVITSDSTLPVTVIEMDVPVVENKHATKVIKPKEEPNEYVCYVCGEKAGKHSYYGGQVCASCRAFFRRSVQSKYYEIFECKKEKNCKINSETRKNCQFCRFKKCLESGMKPSWVLSDEERNRRFNKFNKVNMKSVNSSDKQLKPVPSSRIPELYMTFTIEEQKSLEDVHKRFQVCQKTWLKNLLLLDRDAGVNMIEAAYKVAPLQFQTWKVLETAFHMYFVQNVVPKFMEVDNLPTYDKAQIISGRNSGIAHLFKSSQCLKIAKSDNENQEQVCKKESDVCPLQKQVNDIVSNPDVMDSLDLSQIMSRLDLSDTPRFPTYQEIYHKNWANDSKVEERHMEIMNRIQSWPKNEYNELDYNMVILMTLMLIFNADFDGLVNRNVVENVQLKYSMLLQRYLRSKMSPELANKKFLEAMLLLSYTREVWEMNKLYRE